MTEYGLQVPNSDFGNADDQGLFARVSALAVAAERSGFSSVWVADHFFASAGIGGPSPPVFEPCTLLGALAARTTRVRLGALVTGVTYRHPSILAKQVTTLDVISNGRASLGIGTARHDVEHQGVDIDIAFPGEPLARLEEAVQICRAMFTEEAPSFEGRYYRISQAANFPRPVQAGGPPITVGGIGSGHLGVVARWADAANLTGTVGEVRRCMGILDEHCAEEGRDPATLRRSWFGPLLGDEAGMVEQIQALVAHGVDEVIVQLPFASTAADVAAVGVVLGKAFGS